MNFAGVCISSFPAACTDSAVVTTPLPRELLGRCVTFPASSGLTVGLREASRVGRGRPAITLPRSVPHGCPALGRRSPGGRWVSVRCVLSSRAVCTGPSLWHTKPHCSSRRVAVSGPVCVRGGSHLRTGRSALSLPVWCLECCRARSEDAAHTPAGVTASLPLREGRPFPVPFPASGPAAVPLSPAAAGRTLPTQSEGADPHAPQRGLRSDVCSPGLPGWLLSGLLHEAFKVRHEVF